MAAAWCSDRQESRPPSPLCAAPATGQSSSAPSQLPKRAVEALCLVHALLTHSSTSLLRNNIQRTASVHPLCWLVSLVLYFCSRHNSQNLVLGKRRTWDTAVHGCRWKSRGGSPRSASSLGPIPSRPAGRWQPGAHLAPAAPASSAGSGTTWARRAPGSCFTLF